MKLTPIVAAALVAGALAAPASQAAGAPLHCGATITKSTKLTQDLTNCPGVGLRIGADAITLDLNGHTCRAAAKRNPTAHGILNVGHDRVTIKGGTVKGFGAYGVRLAGVQSNHVVDMKMTANFTGIGLVESSQNLVERSAMTGSRFVGVNLTGGTANRVVHNRIADSIGYGVLLQTSVADHGRHNRDPRERDRRQRHPGQPRPGRGDDRPQHHPHHGRRRHRRLRAVDDPAGQRRRRQRAQRRPTWR